MAMSILMISVHVQARIKSKAANAGGKAAKQGAKGAKDTGKSRTKGKVTKKKGRAKGKKVKSLQIGPTGPIQVNVCDFDSAAPSGKYHLRLAVPAAALVSCPHMLSLPTSTSCCIIL